MDPLVQLMEEDWPELQEQLRKNYPLGIPGFHILRIMLEKPDIKDKCRFRVYCPYGDISNGAIAIVVKKDLYCVNILPVTDDTTKLVESIVSSNVINWKQNVDVPFATPVAQMCVAKICAELPLKIVNRSALYTHVYRHERPPYEIEEGCPPDTYLGQIAEKHISRINEVWPHRYPTSESFFQMLLQSNLCYGLFSRIDDSLIAWVWICEAGFLTHLYCEQNHRSKGYAEFLIKHVTNDQIKQKNDVFCYVVDGNAPSLNLFKKLKYEIMNMCQYIVVKGV